MTIIDSNFDYFTICTNQAQDIHEIIRENTGQ